MPTFFFSSGLAKVNIEARTRSQDKKSTRLLQFCARTRRPNCQFFHVAFSSIARSSYQKHVQSTQTAHAMERKNTTLPPTHRIHVWHICTYISHTTNSMPTKKMMNCTLTCHWHCCPATKSPTWFWITLPYVIYTTLSSWQDLQGRPRAHCYKWNDIRPL